ncbi:hypothetical protein PT974_03705 [Cladobotryum mycophilum]|uniref:Uncharacterized protein n=1 Tax=Cladobotryum mycophilum TaxID=491253 RepID=A0ABR0ST27_9HYPO
MRFILDNIDSKREADGQQMKVIGAGLSRCATSSLQAALEMPPLGYFPCMHMAHVLPYSERAQIVIDALREDDKEKRQALLHKIFDGYQATTDFPGFWFIDDLMDMYPDAAVVLNQRKGGAAAWVKSFDDSIGFFSTLTYYLCCFPIKTDRLHWTTHQVVRQRCVQRWGVKNIDDEAFYDFFQGYVLQEAEKRGRKVLQWRADEGWEPLCEFLGKEPPKNEPFPWVNDAAQMKFFKRVLIARGVLSWLTILGSAYMALTYGPTYLQRVGVAIGKLLIW